MDDLIKQFDDKMYELYKRTSKETKCKPTRFLQMLDNDGGLRTVKKILNNNEQQIGLTCLWEESRLDLSIEKIVLEEPWKELFTEDELTVALKRLKKFGYEI